MARLINPGLTTEQSKNLRRFADAVYGPGICKYLAYATERPWGYRLGEDGEEVLDEEGKKIYEAGSTINPSNFQGYDKGGRPLHLNPDADGFEEVAAMVGDEDLLEKNELRIWPRTQLVQWLRCEPLSVRDFNETVHHLIRYFCLHSPYAKYLPLVEHNGSVYTI